MPRLRALICLSLIHGIVDTFAMLNEPLWPLLSQELRLSAFAQSLLLMFAMLSVNFSQPVFGWLRDRMNTRSVLWIGPLLGVFCLPLAGATSHAMIVGTVIVLGMVGMGAFHPEGVTTAGEIYVEHRTRGISIFLFGGTLGLGAGPLLAGYLVEKWGLKGLPLLIGPGIGLVLLLTMLARAGLPRIESRSRTSAVSIWSSIRTHRSRVALLLVVCTLRVLPAVGIPKAIAFSMSQKGSDYGLIGLTQSVFLSSGSLGMLWLASRFQPGRERWHLIVDPLLAAPIVACLAVLDGSSWFSIILLGLAGLILNGTTAAMVSYAQQALPGCGGLGSSLAMGLSWGLAGILIAILTTATERSGHPEWMYWCFVPSLLLSSLIATRLSQFAESERSGGPGKA